MPTLRDFNVENVQKVVNGEIWYSEHVCRGAMATATVYREHCYLSGMLAFLPIPTSSRKTKSLYELVWPSQARRYLSCLYGRQSLLLHKANVLGSLVSHLYFAASKFIHIYKEISSSG
jgi:hypothetical protein